MADVSSNVPVYIPMQMNIREYGRAIKIGQSRETGNIYRVHKMKKNTTQYSVPARKFGQRGTIIEKRALLHVLAE